MARTIDMWRDGTHADVHPAEEQHYALHGWTRGGGGEPEREPEVVPDEAPSVEPDAETIEEIVSVFRVVDGERKSRASRADISRAEAEAYITERPGNEFVIVVDSDD